jgi:RND family efflux transporter MFP subunit
LFAVAGVGALVAGGAVLAGRSSAPKSATPANVAAPKVVMVTAEPATARPLQRRARVVGSLWGREEVAITPKVDGRISAIHAQVGDIVKPGDLLMEIEPTNYQLAVNEAKRSLELELARLSLTELPDRDFDIDKLPSVGKAIAQEKLAIANRERSRRLTGTARVTEEERDKLEAEVAVAAANTRQTRLEAETALAQVRHKLAVLESAKQKLDDTKVTAPPASVKSSDGARVEYVVGQRNVSEGETVGSQVGGAPVYRLVIAHPLKMLATIPERHSAEVKVGQRVEVSVEAYGAEIFPATVARVNPTVDRASRTFQVEIEVPNADRRLRAGSFAKAAVLTHIDDQAVTVPEEALTSFAGVTKVFVLRDGKAIEAPVVPGVRLESTEGGRRRYWVEVKGDLKPGEPIVTSGQSQLANETPAQIRPTSLPTR